MRNLGIFISAFIFISVPHCNLGKFYTFHGLYFSFLVPFCGNVVFTKYIQRAKKEDQKEQFKYKNICTVFYLATIIQP